MKQIASQRSRKFENIKYLVTLYTPRRQHFLSLSLYTKSFSLSLSLTFSGFSSLFQEAAQPLLSHMLSQFLTISLSHSIPASSPLQSFSTCLGRFFDEMPHQRALKHHRGREIMAEEVQSSGIWQKDLHRTWESDHDRTQSGRLWTNLFFVKCIGSWDIISHLLKRS